MEYSGGEGGFLSPLHIDRLGFGAEMAGKSECVRVGGMPDRQVQLYLVWCEAPRAPRGSTSSTRPHEAPPPSDPYRGRYRLSRGPWVDVN
jgi:hypothetical protein